jgi:hypothetical protein
LPEKFQGICPFLVASLVWHHEWCIDNLPESHPFFNCRYFKNNWPAKLKDYVVMGFGECKFTRMAATGIPQSMVIAGEVVKLQDEVAELKKTQKKNYEDTIAVLPDLVVKAMEGRIQIEGQVSISRRDMQDMFEGMEQRINTRLDEVIADKSATSTTAGFDKNDVLLDNAALYRYFWDGAAHPVAKGWVLDVKDPSGRSTLTVKALWELWFFGHAVNRVPPYRKLKSCDLATKADRDFLSKCKVIMNTIFTIAVDRELLVDTDDLEQKNTQQRDEVFTVAFNRLNILLKEMHDGRNGRRVGERRVGELKIRTYYNDIKDLHKCNTR